MEFIVLKLESGIGIVYFHILCFFRVTLFIIVKKATQTK